MVHPSLKRAMPSAAMGLVKPVKAAGNAVARARTNGKHSSAQSMGCGLNVDIRLSVVSTPRL